MSQVLDEESLTYIEIRPISTLSKDWSPFQKVSSYVYHFLDLNRDLTAILKGCHKNSTQRKIKRAERDGLTYEEGRSETLLRQFYRLFVEMRRRHGAPPPSIEWFRNLIEGFQEALKIRVASFEGHPAAAILTIRFKDTLIYKYGASDVRLHQHGGTQWLLWKSIEEAKQDGLKMFDLGRSDISNSGLITFKNRWGAASSELTYFRITKRDQQPRGASFFQYSGAIAAALGRRIATKAPRGVHRLIGQMLYRHIG